MASYDDWKTGFGARRRHRKEGNFGLTLVELLVVIAVIGLLVAFLLPNVRVSREAARRNECLNNMRQVGLALLNYAESRGGLPPTYRTGAAGNRLHSWRTQILPNLEEQELFDAIDFAKPWDAPENGPVAQSTLSVYHCPSAPDPLNRTTYLAIVTPESAFRATEQRNLADIVDGANRTMLVIEVHPDYSVPWMSPSDLDDATMLKRRGSRHHRVFGALYADGHVEMVRDDISDKGLQSLISIAGHDQPTGD